MRVCLLVVLLLTSLLVPSAGQAAKLPWTNELEVELARRDAEGSFSGCVLVAGGDRVLFTAATGDADVEHRKPNTLETKFRFGSMGKMFTAVAIAQLEQAGKLRYDDALGKFLTDYPNAEVARVTLHQLLTHTGGTGDIFGPDFDAHRGELRELRDYVALYGTRAPDFPPGSEHEYSNYGYILLGRVIEVVSGQSYEAYVREHVFLPAGMKSTGNRPEDSNVPGLARPYTGDPLRPAENTLPWSGTSAGGGYSTVGDLLKFARALRANRLLDAEHTRMVMTGKVDTPRPGLRYAYGFEDGVLPNGLHRVGHGGGAPGMNGVLAIYPERDYVVVVLANRDPPAASAINRYVDEHVLAHR